ncbi:MAG: electron transporter RnfG, partial [Methyloglobulus sp.]|nr:electron transporter RnfG [Methyloglobulus sp.]
MKVDPATIQRIKAQAISIQEFLKDWLQPSNLANLRPKLEFQTGILAGFALIASVLLGVTNCSTESTIQQRLDEDLVKSLEEVIPASLHDNDMLKDTVTIPSTEFNIGANETTVYIAKKSGSVTAVSYK